MNSRNFFMATARTIATAFFIAVASSHILVAAGPDQCTKGRVAPGTRCPGDKNLFALSSQTPPAAAGLSAIYHKDNRMEYLAALKNAAGNNFKKFMEATVAIVARNKLLPKSKATGLKFDAGNKVQTLFVTAKPGQTLCLGERFCDQPTAATCSGTLVGKPGGKRFVLTAAHCFKDLSGLKTAPTVAKAAFVLGYRYDQSDQERWQFDALRACSARKDSSNKVIFHRDAAKSEDWVLVELDCKGVSGLPDPVKVWDPMSVRANTGDALFALGHPSGLPMKYAPKAEVLVGGKNSFTATLDTFRGDSGDGVYLLDKGKIYLVGLLKKGKKDYRLIGGCYRACIFGKGTSTGETVTRITQALFETYSLKAK